MRPPAQRQQRQVQAADIAGQVLVVRAENGQPVMTGAGETCNTKSAAPASPTPRHPPPTRPVAATPIVVPERSYQDDDVQLVDVTSPARGPSSRRSSRSAAVRDVLGDVGCLLYRPPRTRSQAQNIRESHSPATPDRPHGLVSSPASPAGGPRLGCYPPSSSCVGPWRCGFPLGRRLA
jgi:hypothetical protein